MYLLRKNEGRTNGIPSKTKKRDEKKRESGRILTRIIQKHV